MKTNTHPTVNCLDASTPSMEHAVVMVQKLTDAEVERLCCRQDFIKQEVPEEDVAQVDEPNSGSHLEAIYVKQEIPDADLEAITVKEESIDWNQEPEASSGPGFTTAAFKREVDDVTTVTHSRLAETKDNLREGSCGAYNTSAVHEEPAEVSQGSADPLPSDVSGSCSSVQATPPDRLASQPLLCEHCDYSTGRRDLMKQHLRIRHDDENRCKCQSGHYHYPSAKMMWEHRSGKHAPKKLVECKFYSYSSHTKPNLKSPNESSLDRNEGFQGELYEYPIAYETNLNQHLFNKRKITHQASKSDEAQLFRCELCAFSHTRKDELKVHQASKHGIGQLFECELCDYSSGRKTNLKLHQANKHGKGQLYNCELCDYSSGHLNKIKVHQASKHGVGLLFRCELCDYSSARIGRFKMHQGSKHGKGQLFKCDLCDYFSARKDHFQKHQACEHGKGQLFKCELCDYCSARKDLFKKHQACKHGKGKLFKCEFCDYSSGRKDNFKIHQANKHGEAQFFQCELCDYSSCHKSNLKYHQAGKHGKGQLLKCELCDFSSPRKYEVKRHQARKHGKGV